MDPVIWPLSRATFKVCSSVCMYSLELFMRNFCGIFHIFGSFVPCLEGQMFHAWKFHTKVLYSSTIKTASFWTPWSCGGHQVTTKDASCNNLPIAKEQLKGKLTVVPIKNPNDHEMLKIIIQVLKDYTTELNFSGMWEDLFTIEEYSEPLQN